MKPEVIRPRRRIPWRRVLVAIAIAWASWCASRVLEGLERADRASEMRGPGCTWTEYYEAAPVVPECRFGRWLVDGRCGP